jgi:hypothetical protein
MSLPDVHALSGVNSVYFRNMGELRLGDVIDDFCVKCKRITNHSVVSIVNGEPAKVRCRTCYSDHDYRHEQAPPSKKDLKKAELFNEVLAASGLPDGSGAAEQVAEAEPEPVLESEIEGPPAKTPKKGRARKS